MRFMLPVLFFAVFIGYLAYMMLLKKKSAKQLRPVIYPGLFFIGIWIVIYFLMLR